MNDYVLYNDDFEYNLLTVTYPDTVTEVYTYTMSGIAQGTKTIVYTDATKARLFTVTIAKL